ncbi:hypothetical protein B0H63DRAFT_457441 [Podospora didyma]|uniref:Uncharacterized protein n=1 Tax=Podospora didyma TaxID=330526 RepID=A0AAE0U6V0_9PEZI|nr:hypothetical protein B0H63DRAFT_457441 [Podospora didyma]
MPGVSRVFKGSSQELVFLLLSGFWYTYSLELWVRPAPRGYIGSPVETINTPPDRGFLRPRLSIYARVLVGDRHCLSLGITCKKCVIIRLNDIMKGTKYSLAFVTGDGKTFACRNMGKTKAGHCSVRLRELVRCTALPLVL